MGKTQEIITVLDAQGSSNKKGNSVAAPFPKKGEYNMKIVLYTHYTILVDFVNKKGSGVFGVVNYLYMRECGQ